MAPKSGCVDLGHLRREVERLPLRASDAAFRPLEWRAREPMVHLVLGVSWLAARSC